MSDSRFPKRLLLSSVGVSGPKETNYTDGRKVETGSFSAFGMWKLLPEEQRPGEVWFLLTPLARRRSWEAIQSEAAKVGIPVVAIDVTGDADDTRDFLEQTARRIPAGCRLTLNVTEGLRHHAFLFYALALYLTAFREVHIEGVWYCRLETDNPNDAKPLIDLKRVLDLAHWFHALAVFQDAGLTVPMARLLCPTVRHLRAQAEQEGNDPEIHRRASQVEKIVDVLESFSFAYAAGLPLELGRAARSLVDQIGQFPVTDAGRNVPLAEALGKIIVRAAESTAFSHRPNRRGPWKESTPLNCQELERQARMIDLYLDRRQVALAAGLMREWVISWLMLRQGRTSQWLGYSQRKPFEQMLGALGALVKDKSSPVRPVSEQKEFADFWNRLSDDIRNALLHHGMRPAAMESIPDTLQPVREFWNRLKNNEIELRAFGGGKGRLLITSIGLTPGVLYSALVRVEPDRAVVICSNDSAAAIDEAVEKTGAKIDITRLAMIEPHTGIDEFDPLIHTASLWLFEADEIDANLTGGTALMGVLVNRLVQRAQRHYQRPVRQFVLIDKRPPKQQCENPWQLGEIHYLDVHRDVELHETSHE